VCVCVYSTIGVQQSLLEVNKVGLRAHGGGWCVVDDGSTSLMKVAEVRVCVCMCVFVCVYIMPTMTWTDAKIQKIS